MSLAQRIRVDPERLAIRKLQPAVDALRAGEAIIYPTDTGYAFGCAISSHRGVEELRKLKGIPDKARKPLTILVRELGDLSRFGRMSNTAFRLVRRLLPGPYTVVLVETSELPRALRNPGHEVGMRIPDDPICTYLLEALGEPILNASVRAAEEADELEEPDDLMVLYQKKVAALIDVGPIWPDPSTILRFVDDEMEVLRVGKGPVPE